MQCKLCLRDHEALRHSHILPELLWRPLYDSQHRIATLSNEVPRARILQKGLREHLLCIACEKVIQRYEDYFANLWYQTFPPPTYVPLQYNAVIAHVDYTQFKLFHLSILWRQGVAEAPEFSDVSLGAHEPRLRDMLLTGDAGASGEYPLDAWLLLRPDSRERSTSLIGVLNPYSHEGRQVYTSIYGSCAWGIMLSDQTVGLIEPSLREDGRLVLATVDVGTFTWFEDFLRKELPRLQGPTLWNPG